MDEHSARFGPFRPLAGEPSPYEPVPRGVRARTAMPLDGFADERELADRVLGRLDRSFIIEREVHGTHCTGRRMRIDAVIRPREPDQWRNSDVALGIEFKYPAGTYNPGARNYTKWAAQVVDYTHVEWDGYGYLHPFACPPISLYFHQGDGIYDTYSQSWLVSHLFGQLGVGELFLFAGYGLTLLFKDHRIWTERSGVVEGRNWDLKPKFGSR